MGAVGLRRGCCSSCRRRCCFVSSVLFGLTCGPGQGRCSSCRRRCCFVLSVAFGLTLLLLAGWVVVVWMRFTPIYKDIECHFHDIKVSHINFTGVVQNLTVEIHARVRCENDNPYNVSIESFGMEKVYIGKARLPVASVINLTESVLPARGKALVGGFARIRPVREVFGDALGFITGHETEVYFENDKEMEISAHFMFGRLAIRRPFSLHCGLTVKIFFNEWLFGPLACAQDLASVHLVSMYAIPPYVEPTMRPENATEETFRERIDEMSQQRNYAFGTVSAFSIIFGVALLCCCPCCCPCCRRRRHCFACAKGKPNDDEVDGTQGSRDEVASCDTSCGLSGDGGDVGQSVSYDGASRLASRDSMHVSSEGSSFDISQESSFESSRGGNRRSTCDDPPYGAPRSFETDPDGMLEDDISLEVKSES
mmetsp:Transcript_101218/g.291513  ORF Transcript_101218/g.291513 Transcript_101218/m.291513 type:complete len:425 (-) Transcript_101218:180-1454(-)